MGLTVMSDGKFTTRKTMERYTIDMAVIKEFKDGASTMPDDQEQQLHASC
jgi:hypothetical protein